MARLQDGRLSGDRGPLTAEAVDQFIPGLHDGSIRDRSGQRYKHSTIRGYERDLRQLIVPAFGAARLGELTLPDVQRWADALAAEGRSPSTVRNNVNPLRALYGWALPRGMLIAALLPSDQAALGLAVYGGLRLGELLAIGSSDIDLEARTMRVVRSWDHGSHGFVAPKSKAGTRTVPIIDRLALLLSDHRVLTNQGDGLLFTRRNAAPISPTGLRRRMQSTWRAAGLDGLGFHEARHTFASLMIAAGVNAKALSTYMGHASVSITFDRYGHLMPGNEHEARGLLDAYLAAADE